ncbi:MAG: PKD domain-containing protein [Chitinispirillaceae bacterium]
MRAVSHAFLASALFLTLLFTSCALFESGPEVLIIVGEVSSRSGNETSTVSQGQKMRPADTVVIPADSKMKMGTAESYIYASGKSRFHLEKQDKSRAVSLILHRGELFFVARDKDPLFCKMNDLTVKMNRADAALSFDSRGNPVVEVLAGEVSVKQAGMDMIVGSCRRVIFRQGDAPQEFRLEKSAVSRLKSWVGETAVGIPVKLSGCFRETAESKRDSVMETRVPQLQFVPDSNDEFVKPLPKKKIRKKKKIPGAELKFEMVVPRRVQLKQAFPVVVKPSSAETDLNGCAFRFDFDGDGKFEYPKDGAFGRGDSVTHAFSEGGKKSLVAEVKTPAGDTVEVAGGVDVNSPPKAMLKADSAKGTAGSPVFFDASSSSDTRDSLLAFRWDLDGDGKWDFPSDSGFASKDTISRTWNKEGTHRVGVLVRDRDGAYDSAWISVDVLKGFAAESISCPEQAFAGEEVTFRCVLKGKEDVAAFNWRFKNENIVMKRRTEKPQVTVAMRMPGVYDVACDVQGEKGVVASQQTTIRIVNSSLEVSAGGPYKGMVRKAVSFRGEAKSAHGGIVHYGWDFDGDNKLDVTSAESSRARHVFKRAGEHTVYFTARATDGSVGKDSAVVRIDHKAPVADAGEDRVSYAGRKVKLSGSGTDPDGEVVKYEWDFDGDGKFDWSSSSSGAVEHVFDVYSYAVLRVTDADGKRGLDTVKVVVCPEGMATIENGRFCIDKYEWPNQRGSVPEVNVTWHEARKACEKIGKRLCTADEWKRVCRDDDEDNAFPYGKKFEAGKCNTLGHPKQVNKLSASGSFPDCAGSLSIFDMSGNAAEWTASGGSEADAYGGFYQSGAKEGNCSSRLKLKKNKKYFYTGFRCCK